MGRAEAQPERLMLDKENGKIAGVCAGFARSWDVDVTLIRVIWLVVAISTAGCGFLAYLIAWMVMPSDRTARTVHTAAERV